MRKAPEVVVAEPEMEEPALPLLEMPHCGEYWKVPSESMSWMPYPVLAGARVEGTSKV